MSNPWKDPSVAQQQRALVDHQLAEKPWPPHFTALAEAVRATQCPGEILEVGCASGYGREILDRAGIEYRRFDGIDISPEAIRIANERYPESQWIAGEFGAATVMEKPVADVVVDGCALMHVDDWRAHITALCKASRRWVVLHRVPCGDDETQRIHTQGYGQTFPAWFFDREDIAATMQASGFQLVSSIAADGESRTLTFAKSRHFCSYADGAYLGRLKALHASMVRHCGPFELHVLAWKSDDESTAVATWCDENGIDCVTGRDFLDAHPELELDKLPGPRRSYVEHMYTCGPRFVADVMDRTGEPCAFADADLYAFSSPEPFFAEAGGAPAAFVGHNFAPASRGTPGPTVESHAGPFGALNVGLMVFNDQRVAERWSDLVRGWCFSRCELVGDRWQYADQKFLEQLCDEFPACVVIKNEAAMVGPWNVNARSLDLRDGVPYFGNRPIGFYHFSALQMGQHGQWSPTRPEYRISERVVSILYSGYVREIDGPF